MLSVSRRRPHEALGTTPEVASSRSEFVLKRPHARVDYLLFIPIGGVVDELRDPLERHDRRDGTRFSFVQL